MKLIFYQSDKNREALIAGAFCFGAQRHGVRVERRLTQDYQEPELDTDIAVTFGVKGQSRRIMDDHLTLGAHVIYIDKGYLAMRPEVSNRLSRAHYYKVSLDGFQPLKHLYTVAHSPERWEQLVGSYGLVIAPWRAEGDTLIWAGPSQKYCDFHRLGDAHEYSASVIAKLASKNSHEIVYRPKHSWRDAREIPGARLSRARLSDDLREAWAFVTHGSNSSVAAILAGVPVVALGPCIAAPLATRSMKRLRFLGCPSDAERLRWLHEISWWHRIRSNNFDS